jgi:hypothetical protein
MIPLVEMTYSRDSTVNYFDPTESSAMNGNGNVLQLCPITFQQLSQGLLPYAIKDLVYKFKGGLIVHPLRNCDGALLPPLEVCW